MADNNEKSLSKQIDDILNFEQEVKAEKEILLKKAESGEDANALIKARNINDSLYNKSDKEEGVKSFTLDPLQIDATQGWKRDHHSIDSGMLRSMARTPYVRAIINTRIDQIVDFCRPQSDKYSVGFVIEKEDIEQSELSKEDLRKRDYLIKVIENCGEPKNSANNPSKIWTKDQSFENFVKKWVKDSLELDAGTFEVVETKKGGISEFFSVDGATIFKADNYEDTDKYSDEERNQLLKNGFYPEHVQVLQNGIVAEYYPWELCYGIRNPSSELHRNLYGYSELNSLVHTVTALLNADHYNSNFFKVGSAPQGLLAIGGENMDRRALNEFKKQWQAQVAGVNNAGKIPVINSEKAQFVNTHMANKDMEFSHYHEFLIRLLCVLYKMSPKEIGLTQGGKGQGGGIQQKEDTKEEINYSKEKGLKPILKLLEKKINKYVISRIDPNFKFRFAGLDADSQDTELDRDVKSVQYIETYNDIRRRKGLKPVDWGDVPLNPTAIQAKQMAMMGGEESNQFIDQEEQQNNDSIDMIDTKKAKEANPLLENFEDWVKNDLNSSYDNI